MTVVGPDEIAERAPATIADYLRVVPGAFVQSTTPGQAIPIVRGLKGSEVLHMVDGFRLNTAIFGNAPNQYFALVDAQNVDRIEVVRGPASTLYGSDAMGGVVQVLTPEQRFEGTRWDGRRPHPAAEWTARNKMALGASMERRRLGTIRGPAGPPEPARPAGSAREPGRYRRVEHLERARWLGVCLRRDVCRASGKPRRPTLSRTRLGRRRGRS